MLKKLIHLLLFFLPLFGFSQDYSQLWEGHFSYLNIKDVSQGNNKIYAAAENAVFIYDLISNDLETISTINGLSGETISTIHYSETYGLLLIGYENGLMEIISDSNDDVLTIIDILEKPTIPPTDKKINHFNEFNEVVYISTDYGISVYNLENLEFGDTYFIGNAGSQVIVKETSIFGDYIYAACQGGNGLKKAIHSDSNIIDFQQWQTVAGGNLLHVQTVNDKLFVIRNNKKIYEVNADSLIELFTYTDATVDAKTKNNNLIITTKKDVFIYDDDFNIISNVTIPQDFNIQFTSSTVALEDELFIGTTANINQGYTGKGVLKTSFTNSSEFEEIHPDGPLSNSSFSIEATQGNLWLTFGEYTIYYDPYPKTRRGISHLIDESWVNIPFDSVLGATDLNKISINPDNSNQVFISSFISGILEVNDNVPTVLYDQTNSGLESLELPWDPDFINVRVSGSNFDNNGLLWSVTSLVEKPLKSFNPSSNQWQSFDFSDLIEDHFSNLGFGDLLIDNNENKWIASYGYGLIGAKTNGSNVTLKSIKGEADEGNLPSNNVTALQFDRRNQLWIGTDKGLRVLYNPESVFTDDVSSANEIIILDDGIPRELMYQQWVSHIEVDGSNNKWIGTFTTGLFYFSENGQETIYHFTKDNSPLPSNNILDISIDDSTGKVYIATDKGLVAFKSGGSKPKTVLENAFIYPNPVRPSFNITEERVKIKDISENINIKITDIEGNLVAEAQSNTNLRYKGYNLEIDGGTAFWNGKNLANNTVASGVYLVLLSDLDTLETKVLKLMVVR